MDERDGGDLGTYSYAEDLKAIDEDGGLDLLSLEYLVETGACVVGHARRLRRGLPAVRGGRGRHPPVPRQPLKIPHEAVMQTIELMGREVIPHFR